MSIFGSLFGNIKYSQTEHQLPSLELKKILWHIHLASIKEADKQAVEAALIARRGGDDKISLQQVYETLLRLQRQNQISKYDRLDFMKIFLQYFQEHFGK